MQGSLRVIDTIYATNSIQIPSATASQALGIDANKKIIANNLTVNPNATATNQWVSSVAQNASGQITITTGSLVTSGTWAGTTNKAVAAAITSTTNAIAYYTNTAGTFSSLASESGALFTTTANGSLTFGTLPIAQGGTGLTANPIMITNLASTATANVLSATPTPGVTGTLPISNGGTGASSFTADSVVISGASTTAALSSIAITPGAFFSTTAGTANFNILPVECGGIGANSVTSNLVFASPNNINGQLNSGEPGFRKLVSADFADLPIASTTGYGIIYSNTAPTSVSAGSIWMRPTSISIEELKCYAVPINNFTGDTAYTDSNITDDMIVIDYEISDPSVVIGDIAWYTSTGSLVLNGTIVDSESTNLILYLLKHRGA